MQRDDTIVIGSALHSSPTGRAARWHRYSRRALARRACDRTELCAALNQAGKMPAAEDAASLGFFSNSLTMASVVRRRPATVADIQSQASLFGHCFPRPIDGASVLARHCGCRRTSTRPTPTIANNVQREKSVTTSVRAADDRCENWSRMWAFDARLFASDRRSSSNSDNRG